MPGRAGLFDLRQGNRVLWSEPTPGLFHREVNFQGVVMRANYLRPPSIQNLPLLAN